MASLWQFFGLPNPEAPAGEPKPPTRETPLEQPTPSLQSAPKLTVAPKEPAQPSAKPTLKLQDEASAPVLPKSPPPKWKGPVTAEGEAFHDLGAHVRVKRSLPRRALRYVSPDAMNRIPTREMARRVQQGDSVIVDLRTMVHMDTHQNVCRRELQHMGNETGIGVFALDAEDKLLLLPGKDVVVDIGRHELGLQSLLSD